MPISRRSFVVNGGSTFIFLTTDPLRQHPSNMHLAFNMPFISQRLIEIKGQIKQTVRVCLSGEYQFLRAICVHAFRTLDRFREAAPAV